MLHHFIFIFLTDWGKENGRHFPDNIFKCIFINENICISIKISMKIVPNGPINNIPALVQIMAWRRPGDKPLSESMMAQFTDIYMCHSASMSCHGFQVECINTHNISMCWCKIVACPLLMRLRYYRSCIQWLIYHITANWASSSCQLHHHWWHHRLSPWQPLMPQVITKLAS